LQRPVNRPNDIVADGILRVTPPGELNIDLVSRVLPHVPGRVIEQAKHDIIIQAVEAPGDLKLIRAESQPLLHGHLSAIPNPIVPGYLQMQTAGGIQPDILGIPVIWARASLSRPDSPVVTGKPNRLPRHGGD